jgi:hypothetical protein
MSLRGSMLLGLENVAQTTHENNLVYRVLKLRNLRRAGKKRAGPITAGSRGLEIGAPGSHHPAYSSCAAVRRVLTMDQALVSSIDELTEEINSQTEEQMQRLPLRITLLSLPFLLGPIVILFSIAR